MEVILLENIKKLGSIGQKVKVKDGYGRNFLIKRNKALIANKKNMEIFKKQKDEINKKNEIEKSKSLEIAKKIKSLKLVIKKEAMENSQLYGSVSVKEIIALLDDDSRINNDWLIKHLACLEYFNSEISAGVSLSQIKSLGVHKIFINLHAEVQSSVDLEIKPVS